MKPNPDWLKDIKSVWNVKTAFVSDKAPSNQEIRILSLEPDSPLSGVQAVVRKETTWTYLG